MTITCPSCDASYRIAPDALGVGRTVRCARCKSSWFAEGGSGTDEAFAATIGDLDSLESATLVPIEGLDDAVAIDVIESSDPRAHPEAYEPHGGSAGRGFATAGVGKRGPRSASARRPFEAFRPRPAALVAALALVCLGVLIGGRVDVVRAAPSLASLYARIGLPVNVRGLTISDVRSVERVEEGVPLLLVSGLVRNVSGDAIDVPRLKLTITADRDRELYAWTTVAGRAKLAPGESTGFRARLASPPAEGRGLSVRFVGQTDLARANR